MTSPHHPMRILRDSASNVQYATDARIVTGPAGHAMVRRVGAIPSWTRQSMAKIAIADGVEIDEKELDESFVRASGPGGQNVNKVSSAVQLRFNVAGSPSLAPDVRERLGLLAGRRMTKDGELVIVANRFRAQERNREDARARLFELIARAAEPPPPPRRKTRPPKASKERRLSDKKIRSQRKRERGVPPE